MYSRPMTTPANARSSDYPPFILAQQNGTNFDCYEQSDLFINAIPAALGTNLLEGPVVLDSNFVGMHVPQASAASYAGCWNRSHDMAPRWSQMNPANGVYRFDGILNWLRTCKSVGSQTVVTLFSTPTWASARPAEVNTVYPSDVGGMAEPANMAYLSTFVTQLMLTCGDYIDYIEVWNEPQTAGNTYYTGTPAKLAEMARTINLAAKAIKPSVKILGVACTGVNNNTAGFGIDYTDQFLKASDGAAGTGKLWIDAISLHTYEHSGLNKLSNMYVTKGYVTTLKANNGIAAMPVWSTEFGYINPDFSLYTGTEANRAKALLRFFLWNVAIGMQRATLYPLGWSSTDERAAYIRSIAAMLNGATVTRINQVGTSDGLACIINGTQYLV